MGLDSFQIPGVPAVSIYSLGGWGSNNDSEGIKEISFSSGRCSNKKELASFITALDDVKNNWDVWNQYLIESGEAKTAFYNELRTCCSCRSKISNLIC